MGGGGGFSLFRFAYYEEHEDTVYIHIGTAVLQVHP